MNNFFIFKRNNGFYYLQYLDESENRTKRVSTRTYKKDEALKFLSNFKSVLSNKKLDCITLSQFLKLYIDTYKVRFSLRYLRSVEFAFRQLIGAVGDIPLTKLSHSHLTKFITERFQRTQYGAAAIQRILKAAFNKAVEMNYIEQNPIKRIKLPKIPEKKKEFITKQEFETLLANEPTNLMRDIYIFAFNTGMRLNEILNCKLSWIDLHQRIITISNSEEFTTKSKRVRIVPINDAVFNVIKRNLPNLYNIDSKGGDADTYLFSKVAEVKLNPFYVSKKFKKIARKTFGKDTEIHFHDLRGSFGSELIRKNNNILSVQKLLGHASVKTTEQHYIHVSTELLRNAVNSL